MSPAMLEALATSLYTRLGFDPSRPVSTFTLARQLLGTEIARPTSTVGSPGAVMWSHGRRFISVRAGLPLWRARFVAGHEIGHLLLEQVGYREPDTEAVCDHLGAALQAPLPAVAALRDAFGDDVPRIVAATGGSPQWAALRVGGNIETALRSPVIESGGAWSWPSAAALRRWARGNTADLVRVRIPGMGVRGMLAPPPTA